MMIAGFGNPLKASLNLPDSPRGCFRLQKISCEEVLLAGTGCLITDVRMPGMGGLDLQRCVRVEAPGLPVIFITGHHEDEVERCAYAQGAAFFIHKPFDAGELLRAIKIVL